MKAGGSRFVRSGAVLTALVAVAAACSSSSGSLAAERTGQAGAIDATTAVRFAVQPEDQGKSLLNAIAKAK